MQPRSHCVLIVEDDEDLRDGLAFLLTRRGYSVITAAGGREALQELERMDAPPCMIILDLMMPEVDGWEVRRRLLERPPFDTIPVVLLSGVADLDEAARALKAADYLRKPVDFDRLFYLVNAHC